MLKYSIEYSFTMFIPLGLLSICINLLINVFINSNFILKDQNLISDKIYYNKIISKRDFINRYFGVLFFISFITISMMPRFMNNIVDFYVKKHSDDNIISLLFMTIFIIIVPSRINHSIFLTYNDFKISLKRYNLSANINKNKLINIFLKLDLAITTSVVILVVITVNYIFNKGEIIKYKIMYGYYVENQITNEKIIPNYPTLISKAFGTKNQIDFIPWSSTKEEVKTLSKIKLIEEQSYMLKYLYSNDSEIKITIMYFFNINDMLYKICATSEISDINFMEDTITYINEEGSQCKYPYSIIKDLKIIDGKLIAENEDLDEKLLLTRKTPYDTFIKENDMQKVTIKLEEGSIKLDLLNEFKVFDEDETTKKPYDYEFDFYILSTLKQNEQSNNITLEMSFFNPLSQVR